MRLNLIFALGTLIASHSLAQAQSSTQKKTPAAPATPAVPTEEERKAALKEFLAASGVPNQGYYSRDTDSPITRHELDSRKAYTESERREILERAGERSDVSATFYRRATGGWGVSAEIPSDLLKGDDAAQKVAREKWTKLHQLWEKAGSPSQGEIVRAAADGTVDPSQVGRLAADTNHTDAAGRAAQLKNNENERQNDRTPEQRAAQEKASKNMEDLLASYFSWIKDRPSGGVESEIFNTRTDEKFASVYQNMARCTSDSCAESELARWLKREMGSGSGSNDSISSVYSESQQLKEWSARIGAIIAETKAENAANQQRYEADRAQRYRRELRDDHAR